MNRRVVVTGLGFIAPHGSDPEALFASLMRGQSAIREIAVEDGGSYRNIAAPVEFQPSRHFRPEQRLENYDRVTQFSLASASAALKDAGIEFDDDLRRRSGVTFGTGMGSARALEETFTQVMLRDPDRVRPLTVLKVMNNASAGHIAMQYGFGGPDLTYSCACSSSAVAIGEAFRQIRHGYADVMIAGGAEAPLTFTLFKSWDAMRVLAPADRAHPSASCRPFAKNRAGLVLGEGAAMVVLEEYELARRRGARIYAEVTGYGSSNDHSHITKPSVDGQAYAMKMALDDGEVAPEDVGYVNAHGTATQLNDATETAAIKRVFGEHAYRLAVSSTKSMHGHLLGGAGALEFGIALLALRNRAVPPTAHLEVADPECDLDYVRGEGRAAPDLRCVMSSSFAFGGTNAVLVARAMN
jgi:3-oxoacyl-[acyl-carrier-protein] synthase II